MGGEILLKCGGILGSALGAADGIEFKSQVADTECVEGTLCECYDLGIGGRLVGAEALHSELVELSESARLRLLVAVAGKDVADLLRQGLIMQSVLQKCTHRACGALGAQRDTAAAVVVEGIHLLLHDVGGVTDRAVEKLGMFKYGGAYFAEAVKLCIFHKGALDVLPACAVLGQNVLRSFYRLCYQCHFVFSFL